MAILLADIGGTHARLAYFEAGHIKDITFFNCEDFKTPMELLQRFIQNKKFSGIFLSVAGPVQKGCVRWTNRPDWKLSESAIKKRFKVKKAFLVNDMVAQAYGLNLPENQKALLMNVGTGFGSSLIFNGAVFPCEFGLALDEKNRKKEYFLSGQGIVRIYHESVAGKKIASAKLLDEMRSQGDKNAIKSYEKFYKLWGKTAGNIATGLMLSHVYLWGGLIPKNKQDMQYFLTAFHHKKYPDFNQKISVKIVREKSLALKGLAFLSAKKDLI